MNKPPLFYIAFLVFLVSLKALNAHATNPHREFPSSVHYVENKGQWEDFIKYEAEFRGGKLFLEASRFMYVFYHPDDMQALHPHEGEQIDRVRLHAVRIKPVNPNVGTFISAEIPATYFNNYFIGNDSSKWASNVSLYSNVVYNDLFPRIDMKFYSSLADVKYDFVIRPGGNPSDICLEYEGADKLFMKDESLFMQLSVGEIVEEKPYAYQVVDGQKKEVECKFRLNGNKVSYRFPRGYDKTLPVIIDPTLIFSSFTGSMADNWGFTATYDAAGDLYSGGNVNNVGYPVTTGAFQLTYGGGGPSGNGWQCDIAIAKFNPTGTTLLYATYLGGSNNDQPQSLIVDGNDNLVIFGTTYSANFPVVASCFDTSINGLSDIIISKLSTDGSTMLASTFVGGADMDGINTNASFNGRGPIKYNYSDESRGEIISDGNNDYIIGTCSKSLNFPTTAGTMHPVYRGGLQDGVVFKINSSLSSITWSTFIGGNKEDAVYDILLDPYGDYFICGGTNSLNFPTTTGAINPTFQGGSADGFLAHMNANGSGFLSSSYIGTPAYDQTFFVEIDLDGDVYCMGQTEGLYPVSSGVYSNFHGKQFIHKLTPDLTYTEYSTVFGSGSIYPNISPTAFLVDTCENVYVAGWGRCLTLGVFTSGNVNGMPVTSNAFQSTTNGCDFYFIVLSRDALTLSYATFFGGSQSAEHVDGGTSRFDKNGVIYEAVCAGCGGRSDFPTTPGVVSNTNNSTNCNNGVIKLALNLYQTESHITTASTAGCIPLTVNFTNSSMNSVTFLWDFGDGTPTSTAAAPTHTFANPGVYNVMLIATNNNSCNRNDTSYVTITAVGPLTLPTMSLTQPDPCGEFFLSTQPVFGSGISYSWDFGDGGTSTLLNPTHLYTDSGYYQISLIMVDSMCPWNMDTALNDIRFLAPAVTADVTPSTTSGCEPLTVSFSNISSTSGFHFWDYDDGSLQDTTFAPSHTFASGNYDVLFIVSDSLSCNGGDTSLINVNVLPLITIVADFDTVIHQQCAAQSADFSFTGSGGNTFSWDFGDGSIGAGSASSHSYSPGNYQVTLIASDSVCGSSDTLSQAVTFYPAVTAVVAAAGATSGCPPLNVSFVNTSSSSGSHFWDFADGSSPDTTYNATHTFNASGNYQVMFVVNDSLSCNAGDTAYVNVNVLPSVPVVATFNSVVHSSCTNPSADFSFTGSGGNSYAWDFGDGSSGFGQNVTHVYPGAGNYTVTLTVDDTLCGSTGSITQVVSFYPPAAASVAISGASTGCPPLNVTFLNNSSINGNHFWNFMDGSPVDTNFNTTHTFANLGTYQVMFVVTDPMSCNIADTAYVTVIVQSSVQVVAAFNTILNSQCTSPSADFIFTGTGGVTYSWDFGDGNSGGGPNVTHAYSGFGTYQVTLTVNDPVCGSNDVTNQSVSFYPPVSASVAAIGATTGCNPLNVSFANSSSTGGNHYWDFMDGTTDTTFTPTHTFANAGTFHVMFVVSDPLSCNGADTSYVDVIVNQTIPVNATFISNLSPSCSNPSAGFSFTGTGGNIYSWDFGDGTTSTGTNVNHVYPGPGNYQVTLNVNDTVCGLSGTASQSVSFYPAVDATTAISGSASGCPPLQINFLNSSSTSGNHFWDFMDGSLPDTNFAPTHIFSNIGSYQVMFVVADNQSCNGADTSYLTVSVVAALQVVADFDTILHSQCTNPSADFTSIGVGGTTFNWDFGDGTFASGPVVSHNYSGAGIYQVTLTVDDSVCNTNGNNSQQLIFYPPVVATANAVGATGCPPLNVSFSNSGGTGNYSWNFMDGSLADTSANPVHTFTVAGTYDVELIVSNLNSCNVSDTDHVQVNVTPATPVVASFTIVTGNDCDSLDAVVNSTGTGGNIFSWDFGDGSVANGSSSSHHFSQVGTYVITLLANDTVCSGSDTDVQSVVVRPAISAEILPDNFAGCAPQTVSLSSMHTTANYFWDFDDNTVAYQKDVVHTFDNPGEYYIRLIVIDIGSCNLSDTALFKFDVYENPVADFSYVKNSLPQFTDVELIDQSSSNSVFYRWDFSDNFTDTTSGSIMHKYFDKGTYDVCLHVATIYGCADSTCREIVIENQEIIFVPSSFSPNGDGVNDEFKIYSSGITELNLVIYDRWGVKLFETSSIDDGWNGTYKGKPAVQDVYVYKVVAKGLVNEQIEKTGSVTLIY